MSKEKQIEKSYELIINAFLTLLKVKPFDEITLTEIANDAGVSRMTLYRHFKTKEEILKYRADTMLEMFILSTSQSTLSTEEFIHKFFTIFKELPLRHLITTDRQIDTVIYTYKLELNQQLYLHLKNSDLSKLDDYTFNFLLGGIKTLLNNWCQNDFKEDTLFLTEKIMIFINTLKS